MGIRGNPGLLQQNPSGHHRNPKTSSTTHQKVQRPMPWSPTTNHMQQSSNPSSLQGPICKKPPQHPEPKPDNTSTRINTFRPVQHTKNRTSVCQSQLARPTCPNRSSSQLQEITLGEKRSLNTMQCSWNINGAEDTKLTTITQRQCRDNPNNSKNRQNPSNKSTTPGPISRIQVTTKITKIQLNRPVLPLVKDHPGLHIPPNNSRRTHKNSLSGSRLLLYQPDIRRGSGYQHTTEERRHAAHPSTYTKASTKQLQTSCSKGTPAECPHPLSKAHPNQQPT